MRAASHHLLLSKTVSRSRAKWLHRIGSVVLEALLAEESLRHEALRLSPVFLAIVCGPLPNGHDRLVDISL